MLITYKSRKEIWDVKRVAGETIRKVKHALRILVQMILNPRLLLCIAIAWLITNGWSYILLTCGLIFHISWMQIVSLAYIGFLWFPFTPEKVITLIISIFLLRLLFPKDEKTLGVLRTQLHRLKESHQKRKTARKTKRNDTENG